MTKTSTTAPRVRLCRRCGTALVWDRELKTNVPAPVGYWDEEKDEPAQYTPKGGCTKTFMAGQPCEPGPVNP
jgi:hypothetical protein